MRRWAAAWVLCGLAGCAAPFARHEADLYRDPPPLLPTDANAFWNDPASGAYGELTVGPGLYRRDDAVCRTARVTSLQAATQTVADRTVLYCSRAGGPYQLDATMSCRQTLAGSALTCRNGEGDAVALPPL